jgi:hypothetical protein
MSENWSDLSDKGFVVVRRFLSGQQCDLLRKDYSRPTQSMPANGNYNIKFASPDVLKAFEPILATVSNAVRSATDIDTNLTSIGMYFGIERGINFSWHQDHESYFTFKDHHHYLNFYIPIIKPDVKQTNLSVIPFDRLKAELPGYCDRLVGGGATDFDWDGDCTVATDFENDTEYKIPIDLERLAVTPELHAGDLFLLRGDVIHRTQDVNTERVAISIRRQNAQATLERKRLMSGGQAKRAMIDANKEMYGDIIKLLDYTKRDRLTLAEMMQHMSRRSER